MLTHAHIKTGPYIGLYTQKQDRMFACVHTVQDSMLARAHTHTRPVNTEIQDHMLDSARTRWGLYVGQCTHTRCDLKLASAHRTCPCVGQCTYTSCDHMLTSAHRTGYYFG